MFKVFIDGSDDRLRLEDSVGRKVGWIHGSTIGFGGLASETMAREAAIEGWLSLEKALQRGYPGRIARGVDKSNVRLVHDGAYEWIADGIRPLARLLRPGTTRNTDRSFALEFLVPSHATQHVTIAAAQAVLEALSRYILLATWDAPRVTPRPGEESSARSRLLTASAR
jgi:hypothetical protein